MKNFEIWNAIDSLSKWFALNCTAWRTHLPQPVNFSCHPWRCRQWLRLYIFQQVTHHMISITVCMFTWMAGKVKVIWNFFYYLEWKDLMVIEFVPVSPPSIAKANHCMWYCAIICTYGLQWNIYLVYQMHLDYGAAKCIYFSVLLHAIFETLEAISMLLKLAFWPVRPVQNTRPNEMWTGRKNWPVRVKFPSLGGM